MYNINFSLLCVTSDWMDLLEVTYCSTSDRSESYQSLCHTPKNPVPQSHVTEALAKRSSNAVYHDNLYLGKEKTQQVSSSLFPPLAIPFSIGNS